MRSLGKILLAFASLQFVLKGQTCLLFQISLDFLLLHSSPLWWKGVFLFGVLVLEDLVGLLRTIQLHFLQHYWLGLLGLLWYWMVCLGNEQRSFCRFWDCIQVLHFSSGFPKTKDVTLFYYYYYIYTIYIIYKKIHLQLNCCLKAHSCMYVMNLSP